MDRYSHHEPLLAPAANGGSERAYAPGAKTGNGSVDEQTSWPKLDKHLVKPEVTRDEIVRGERMVAMPSHPEHGDRHFRIDYVLGAHIKREYTGSTDLLTRFGKKSDFATDTCIRKTGKDPRTGERYLEEVAFEVVHTQSDSDIRRRAEDVTTRGVRRFFAIFAKKGQVAEWSPEEGALVPLDPDGEIADPTLATPVSVRALLDAVEADNGVARALLAKHNPVLEAEQKKQRAEGAAEGREEGREEGILEGLASAVISVLAARGLAPGPEVQRTIAACTDARKLGAWLEKAATASSAEEVVRDVRQSAPREAGKSASREAGKSPSREAGKSASGRVRAAPSRSHRKG